VPDFIRRIPVAKSGSTVPANVAEANFYDMVVWDRRIQQPYLRDLGGIGANWHWPTRFVACTVVEAAARRRAVAYQIRVRGDSGRAVPVSQAIFSIGYTWPGDHRARPTEKCVFIWLLCSTPKAALEQFGITDRFATLAPMLDVAIQLSIEAGYEGRLGLHVADEGSEHERRALRDRYAAQGFLGRPLRSGWFRWPWRDEDGDFMYLTTAAAQKIVTDVTCHLR
jgi:hypothetical protein